MYLPRVSCYRSQFYPGIYVLFSPRTLIEIRFRHVGDLEIKFNQNIQHLSLN